MVRTTPPPNPEMAVLTLGILWAEIWEVCVCVCWFPDRKLFFYTPQSAPVLIIYMGLWDRTGNSGYPYHW